MNRVLHVFAKLTRGGIETFVMNVYRGIDKQSVQFDFAVSYEGGEYEDEVRKLGGRIFYIAPRRNGIRAYMHHWNEFFRIHAHEYIAIHQHAPTLTSLEPLYYAKKYGVKKRIIHAHSSSVSGSKYHYITHWLGKVFVKQLATHFVSCSDKAGHWLYDYTGIDKNQIMLLKNGIDLTPFVYDEDVRRAVRTDLHLSNQIVLGHVGRFVPVKNHTFLIDLVSAYRSRNPDVVLLLVGDGDGQLQIEQKVKELGLTSCVKFLGSRPDVARLLQAMDVFVLPSLFEGLPVSLVEAQASGLLTFVSDTVSKDAQITSLIHFCPLSAGVDWWAKKIDGLVKEHTRKNMSQDLCVAGYDVQTVIEKLKEIYLK